MIEPIGEPVRVSQAPFGAQHDSSFAVLTGGRQVAVWTDDWTPGGDGSEYSIKARLLDAAGATIGDEFVVNTTAPGRQDLAGITPLANGGFVIAWLDGVRFGGTPTNTTIRAQEYDSNGVRVGGERLVGTATGREAFVPSLAGLDGGGWAIAWQDQIVGDGSVKGRVYGVPGGVDGAAWQIDRPTPVPNFFVVDENPTLVAANNGGFLVSWQRDITDYRPQPGGGPGPFTNAAFVQARGPDGSALAAPITLASQTTTNNDTTFAAIASVAMTQTDDGRVLATWVKGNFISAFFSAEVFARGFAADGTPLGAVASLGPLTEGLRDEAIEIDLLPGGTAVISHANQGWRLRADGSPDGAGFILARDFYAPYGESSVAATANGIAVAYESVAARADHINVTQLSFAITPIADITLTGSLDEMAPGGVALLRLGSDSRILGETVTYELLADPRGLFQLTGDTLSLRTGGKLDFETRPTETITVRATDAAGNRVTESFVIAVADAAIEGAAFDAGPTIIASEGGSGAVVAGLTDDRVVLAWEGFGIQIGVFDRGGTRLVLRGAGDANAEAPQLAVLANGDIGLGYTSINTSFIALYAARFTPDGIAVGSRQQFGGIYRSGGDTAITAFGDGFAFSFEPVVELGYSGLTASTTLGSDDTRRDPDLATLLDGRVVAVWSGSGVQARLVGPDRVAEGPVFRIDDVGGGEAEVAALGDGGFVIGHAGPTGTTIEVRRFDAAGVAVGAVAQIDGFGAAVAALSDGGFVVGYSVAGAVPDSLELYVQRFGAAGAAVGGPMFIAEGTIFNLSPIDLGTLPLGGFVAAWSDGGGVKVRNFELTGRPTVVNDTVITSEDVAVVFAPLANDIGDSLVLLSARVDTGLVAIGSDGITFIPDADWNGTATITYRIAAASGAIDDGVAKVIVDPVDDAPVITSNGGLATASVSVGENTSAITMVTSSDADAGSGATYSIVGGVDAAQFAIDAATGALSFLSAPNFEAPTDAGANNVYDVIVSASDGTLTDTQAIAVTVTNTNEAPVISSDGSGATAVRSVAENSAAVTTVQATDPDAGTTLTYAVSGGADAARFRINAATGALAFIAAPDFEAPTDAGANNVYDVIVRASDGTLTNTQAIVVTVTNVNDASPVISSDGGNASATRSIAENTTSVTTVLAADPDVGTALTYAISGGADAARFQINAATGALSFRSAPNFEAPADVGANNVYDVIVRASDGTLADTQAIAVTVTNVNDASPVISSDGGGATATRSIAENTTAVTTVLAADPDVGTALTYAISGGADVARFQINAATGALSFRAAPNFEAPADVGANNVYDVILSASDGALVDTQAIAVTVTNANEAPVIGSDGGGATAVRMVAENTTAVTTVQATDPDAGTTLTFAINGGADAARFQINATTGALSFIAAPNFEAPTDAGANNVYDVIVSASDGALTDTQAIAVAVTNANEAPVIGSDGGGAAATRSVAENTTAVTTVIATDPDVGTTMTYAISGGVDAARFQINASTGALAFIAAPNFEAPTDVGANNVYDVIVSASDGTLSDTQAIAVRVNDMFEIFGVGGEFLVNTQTTNGQTEPTITGLVNGGFVVTWSDSSGTLGDSSQTSVKAQVFGSDGTKVGGEFLVNTQTEGFQTEPQVTKLANGGFVVTWSDNSGTLGDSSGDSIKAQVFTAGGAKVGTEFLVNTQTTYAQQEPSITGLAGGGFVITWWDASGTLGDSDGASVKAQVFGADGSKVGGEFLVNTLTAGAQRSATVAAFTNGNFAVTWTEFPAAGSDTNIKGQVFTPSGAKDGPELLVNTQTASTQYNSKVTGLANGGAVVTWYDYSGTLGDSSGTSIKAQVFGSDGTKVGGEFLVNTQTAGFQVDPTVTDLVNGNFLITWEDRGDSIDRSIKAQLFAANGAKVGDEFLINTNTTGGEYKKTITSLANGGFAVAWEDSSVGTLGDGDRSRGSIKAQIFSVGDPAGAPVITSDGGAATATRSIAENTSAITTVQATDPDAGTTLAYAIIGGADAALFQINAATGALSFKSAPNFEVPGDVGANNVYDVIVRAIDGSLADTQAIAITVTNVREVPMIISNGGGSTASLSVAENTQAVTTLQANDNPIYAISGGADAARFQINAATGALAFIAAPNFEAPTDVGANNVYDVIVSASDGTLTDTQAIAVTVTNANDAPAITSNGSGATASLSVAENTAAVTTVQATDPDGGTALTYAIIGGADGARFQINAATGALAFIAAPNFEAPSDASANNVYDVVVSAIDDTLFDTQALAVTVTNANEAPVISSNGGGATASRSIAENTTAVTTVLATDPDAGTTLTYGIAGGADAARFQIDAVTGALAFIAAPDFEAPTDAGANNVYDVIVSASDGTLTDTQAIAVTVTDVRLEAVKVGGEFLVNTQTTNDQSQPAIAMLANGGFVASWSDSSGTLGDSDSGGIKAQLFGADGSKVGGEFLVNTQTASFQYSGQVTGLENGGFVITWYDYSGTLGDGSQSSIKAQMFGANGAKAGTEFLVNTQTTDYQDNPTITGLKSGGFVVTWADRGSMVGPNDFFSVKAQLFGADGTRVGGEFLVNTQTASSQLYPTVADLASGGFVVAWQDYSGTLGDSDGPSIKAQVFGPDGTKAGGELLVNTQTTGAQENPIGLCCKL